MNAQDKISNILKELEAQLIEIEDGLKQHLKKVYSKSKTAISSINKHRPTVKDVVSFM